VFLSKENLPGAYPFTGGVYPYRRSGEDPIRMFAGEGTPERTNRRFHYLSVGQPAIRLSTAFDSVTLYGEDPAIRPDTVAVPFGQGHTALGRYAAGRGANPMTLVEVKLNEAGDLASGDTLVTIEKTGKNSPLARLESIKGIYGEK